MFLVNNINTTWRERNVYSFYTEIQQKRSVFMTLNPMSWSPTHLIKIILNTLRHCISQENYIFYVFHWIHFLRQPKMMHQASDRINTKLCVIMLEVHPWVSPHKDISCLSKLFPKRIYFQIVEYRDLRDLQFSPSAPPLGRWGERCRVMKGVI